MYLYTYMRNKYEVINKYETVLIECEVHLVIHFRGLTLVAVLCDYTAL